jgi:hypothetical protein
MTAKELGLKPVEAPVEVWVPKAGDWVVVTEMQYTQMPAGHIARVVERPSWGNTPEDVDCWLSERPDGEFENGNRLCHCCTYLRPATPAEVQAHEAAIEAAKVPKFGDRVDFKGYECDIVSRCADPADDWTLLHTNNLGITGVYYAKRHEFRIIS